MVSLENDIIFEDYKKQIDINSKQKLKNDFNINSFTYIFMGILTIIFIILSIMYYLYKLKAVWKSIYFSIIIIYSLLVGTFYFDDKKIGVNSKSNNLDILERIIKIYYTYNIFILNFLIEYSKNMSKEKNKKRNKLYNMFRVVYGIGGLFFSVALPIYLQQTKMDQLKSIYKILFFLFIVIVLYYGLFYVMVKLLEPFIFKEEFLYEDYIFKLYALKIEEINKYYKKRKMKYRYYR